MDCNKKSGCGIDESCKGEDEVCRPARDDDHDSKPANVLRSSRFVCLPRSMLSELLSMLSHYFHALLNAIAITFFLSKTSRTR